MKRIIMTAALLATAFVLESRVTIYGIHPNLTVLIAYMVGLRMGPVKGMLAGAGIGMAADSIVGAMVGPMMLSKSTAGYLASFMREGFLIWSPVLGIIALFTLTGLDGLISWSCGSMFGQDSALLSDVSRNILWQSVINALAGPFLRPGDDDF